jgi:DNA-binding MarR family transcriptional regulator
MTRPGEHVGPVSHAVFRLARAHKELAGRLLRDIGLYPGQELLLMQLWEAGPQRQVDLLRTLGSDAATMTRSVQRLERAGLVSRSRNATDARSVIVTATAASEPLRAAVEQAWRTLEESTTGGADQQDRAEAVALLDRLRTRVEAAADELAAASAEPDPGPSRSGRAPRGGRRRPE